MYKKWDSLSNQFEIITNYAGGTIVTKIIIFISPKNNIQVEQLVQSRKIK